jgi:hypothetical protein
MCGLGLGKTPPSSSCPSSGPLPTLPAGWVDACGGGALARSCSNGSSISTDAATPTKAEAASACVFKHGSLARLDSGALLQVRAPSFDSGIHEEML